MKLILKEKASDEKPVAILTVPDNTNTSLGVIYDFGCPDCVKVHAAHFVQVGIHDDGRIFVLAGIHQ